MAILTNNWKIDVLTILTGFLAILNYYLTRTYNYWENRNIKTEKPTLIFGNFFDAWFFKKSIGDYFREYYRKTTDKFFGLYIFQRPYLLIRDPEQIKAVLVKDFQYFSSRSGYDNKKDLLGSANLFTLKNPHWKYMRTKLTPIFTSGKMKQMFPLMVEIGKQLNDYLKEFVQMEKSFEIKDPCAKFTTDIITTCAYGIQANSLTDEKAEFRNVGRKLFTYSYTRAWELLSFFFAPLIVQIFSFEFFSKDGSQFLRNVFWKTIQARENSQIKRPDLIDALIRLKNTGTLDETTDQMNKNGKEVDDNSSLIKFEGDALVAQAAVFFTAGFETSSSTMSFTLYELSLQLDIQERLRNEIRTVLAAHNNEVTYESLKQMKYLDCCIKETLRLYPVLAYLDRECDAKYTFPGTNLTIDKGVPVVISLTGLHMDPKYFKNPEKYDPDRFNEQNKQDIVPFSYMPFGEGPHNCIGERFGLLSTKIGLVYILKDFEVVRTSDTKVPLVIDPKGFLTSTIGGIVLKFKKAAIVN